MVYILPLKAQFKIQKYLVNLVILFMIILFKLSFAQSHLRTWTETTVNDFADNQLTNLIITNNSGGEVQFPHPLIRTSADSNINYIPRFIAKDNAGNGILILIQNGNGYIKKIAPDGREITKSILINDPDKTIGAVNECHGAIFDDGTFLVVWKCSKSINGEYPIYGQIFVEDSIKIRQNFKINETANESGYSAVVLANMQEQVFWIFYSLRSGNNFKTFVQKRDKLGNKAGETFFLNEENYTVNEYRVSVIGDKDGFWAAWEGSNGISSKLLDVYLKRFNYNGSTSGNPFMVNEDSNEMQAEPSLAVDEKSNLLVVWSDMHDSKPAQLDGCANIYGQVFDKNVNRIGRNVKLNSITYQFNTSPYITFFNNEFNISWTAFEGYGSKYFTYSNNWKVSQKFSGEMISSVFNSYSEGSKYDKLSWVADTIKNTYIKFKLRSGKTFEELNNAQWYGPSGISDYYSLGTDPKINPVHDGDSFIQYKALFSSLYGFTPTLASVSIGFIPSDTVAPKPPVNLSGTVIHKGIILKWNPNNDKDLMNYYVYKRTEMGNYNPDSKISIPKESNSYIDTLAITGVKYYYVITAADTNYNESGYSNEISLVPNGINIYVSANGNINGDGSTENPFKTIQQGIDAAWNGDTVRVIMGTFSDSLVIKKRISLIGNNSKDCKITSTLNASNCRIIKGFTITKSIICNNVSPLITENVFTGTYADYAAAISVENNSSACIKKNFINDCKNGIHILNNNNKCKIENNIIVSDDNGILVTIGTGQEIINNTVISKNGMASSFMNKQASVENNIFVSLGKDGPFIYESINSSATQYNVFWNPNITYLTVPGTNFIFDPKFVDMELKDYHLQSMSPCLNFGDPELIFNDTDGTRNDMGAFGGPDPINAQLVSYMDKSIIVASLNRYPGDTVWVNISLDDAVGLASADFIFEYDNSILSFLGAELTDATKGFTLKNHSISPREIKFSLSSGAAVRPGFKDILKLNFVVSTSSLPETVSELTVKDIHLLNKFDQEMSVKSITNGILTLHISTDGKYRIFVDSQNDGIEDGTGMHPFKTISKALNNASEGDSIFVAEGDYDEQVIMKEGVSLIGKGSSVTKILHNYNQSTIIFNNIKNAEISGFTIKGGYNNFDYPLVMCSNSTPLITRNKFEVDYYEDYAVKCLKNSDAVIENNYFNGLSIRVSHSSPVLKNNIIEGSAAVPAVCLDSSLTPLLINNIIGKNREALRVIYSSPLIRNNYISSNKGFTGIYVKDTSHVKIFNNIIKNESDIGKAIYIPNSFGSEIVNNTIIAKGIPIDKKLSQVTIRNNIIVSRSCNSIEGYANSYLYYLDYNDIWDGKIDTNKNLPGRYNISADPIFVDTSNGDYRLQADSPCRDAGSPDVQYNDPDGSRNDMGAYGGPYSDLKWIAGTNTSFSVNQSTGFVNDTIAVSISGENLGGTVSINMTVSYDFDYLKMINISSGKLTKAFSISRTNLYDGSVNLSLVSDKEIIVGTGEILKLYFTVNSTQPANTILKIDSAKVKDGSEHIKNIFNLKNGIVNVILTGINTENNVPHDFKLYQCYPNPFNPTTRIKYELPNESEVKLLIYNILGEEISLLVNKYQKAGRYEVDWNANKYASGVYFYQLQYTNEKGSRQVSTRKMVYLK